MSNEAQGTNPGVTTGTESTPAASNPFAGMPETHESTPVQTTETTPTVTTPTTGAEGVTTPPATGLPAGTTPAVAPAPATQGMTAEQIAQLAAETVRQMQPQGGQQQQQQAEPQLTAEQIAQKYNFVTATPDDIAAIFAGGPEGAQRLTEVLHKTVKMATTLADARFNQLLQQHSAKFEQDIAPMRSIAEERAINHHQTAFYTKYPELNKPEFKDVLVACYQNLANTGFKGTPDEVYAKVNDAARQMIAKVNPQAFAAGAGNGQQQQTQSTSKMSTLPSGGGSGASTAAPGAAGGKSLAEKLFG